jgi:UDP-glucose 4-epimerase
VIACDVAPPETTGSGAPAGVTYVAADITRLDQMLAMMHEHEVTQVVLVSYIMGPLMSPQHSDILTACDVNVVGITNVLEAARLSQVSRLLFFSTVGTYGPQALYGDRPVTEDEILAPASLYGRMKLLNESICDRYSALYGLNVVKVRPSAILGPGSTIWPARAIEPVALGRSGTIQYGRQARDNVVSVDDLVVLLTRILAADSPAHSVYLASGHNVTMGELADAIGDVVPGATVEFPNPDRKPTYATTFDNTRAVTEFDWAVSSLRDSVAQYVDAVRASVRAS